MVFSSQHHPLPNDRLRVQGLMFSRAGTAGFSKAELAWMHYLEQGDECVVWNPFPSHSPLSWQWCRSIHKDMSLLVTNEVDCVHLSIEFILGLK